MKNKVSEEFLQFVWEHRLWEKNDKTLKTVCGKEVEVISPGMRNYDSGPDFFAAKIKIDGQLWVGNVEIHTVSSLWEKHGHNNDEAYNSVILHVVGEFDEPAFNTKNFQIPTLVLEYPESVYKNYVNLQMSYNTILCADYLRRIPRIYINEWISRVEAERLEIKTRKILEELRNYNNDWNEVFYVYLAANFGFKKNAEGFYLLAKTLPFKVLRKHSDNLMQLEALLFGVSGLLDNNCNDGYALSLQREFDFLALKYNLKPIDKNIWKFLRLRPANFPTIRISQFANFVSKVPDIFSVIEDKPGLEKIFELFDVSVSAYWEDHYNFCKKSKRKARKKLSKSSVENIVINSISNFLFAYGMYKADEDYKQTALHLLEQISYEKNFIISKWEEAGIKPRNAFESQGLIQLYNEYCKKGRCLDCKIGTRILIEE